MKTLFLSFLLIFGVSVLSTAQNTKIVFDANYVDTDAGFAGEYLVFADANSKPYTVDKNGDVSGKMITYHTNGQIETVGGMYKGEKNGLWTAWDESGNRVNEGEFMYGAKDGMWRVWDANGNLRYEMHYRKGKRVHTWKVFNEEGNLIEEKSY
jgi:antitoxin component YwqK of YwqJK toxin-antitoxin module